MDADELDAHDELAAQTGFLPLATGPSALGAGMHAGAPPPLGVAPIAAPAMFLV